MKQKIRLGVIGLSEGNGHPYSWSAICNGYNPEEIKNCPFQVIPAYLSKQNYPEDFLKDVRVTHVWTQNNDISEHISRSCFVDTVVTSLGDMVGKVDAVLLARDDAERHLEMSEPFLRAGLPVYIDKPIALNSDDAKAIFSRQLYPGQVFSCSALRYAKEFQLSTEDLDLLGDIIHVEACVMKGWDTYAIHIIDPVLSILGDQGGLTGLVRSASGDRTTLVCRWESGVQAVFSALGNVKCPIEIRFWGKQGMVARRFEDSFYAFREALRVFISVVNNNENPISEEYLLKTVAIVEGGKGVN